MKLVTQLTLVAGAVSLVFSTQVLAEKLVFLTEALIDQTRDVLKSGQIAPDMQRSYSRLLEEANTALTAGPFSVTSKGMTPPSGDKHDYLSISPYWWPDESKSNGLPWIRKDGKTNPASKNDETDSVRIGLFTRSVRALALAYYFSGDEKYAKQGIDYVRAWFITPETRMNPNMNFAQGVPGVADGRRSGLIDSRVLADRMVDSFAILSKSPAWSAQDSAGVNQWLGEYLDWLQTSKLGMGEADSENNHGSWYDLQVAAIAYYLGQDDLARKMVEKGKTRVASQFNRKGEQEHELARTRSYHYSYFNLDALTHLAQIGNKVNVDLWNYQAPNGASLQAGLRMMADYQDPAKEWHWDNLGERSVQRMLPLYRKAAVAYDNADFRKLSQTGKFADISVGKNLADVWVERDVTLLYPLAK